MLRISHPNPDSHHRTAIDSITFNKEREIIRKQHLDCLFNRTDEEMKKEEKLFLELQSYQKELSTIIRERQEILSRFYKGLNPVQVIQHNRRRTRKIDAEKMLGSRNLIAGTPIVVEGVYTSREVLSPQISFRSSRIGPVRSTLYPRYATIMEKLKIRTPERPKMATYPVICRFEELKTNIMTLLDYKKHVEKLEQDCRILQCRKEVLTQQRISEFKRLKRY